MQTMFAKYEKHMIQIVSYSTDNTKRGRTCGSGKIYKQCCGK